MGLGNVAGCLGKGLVAGVAGTAAMTLSNLAEMRFVTGRSGSMVPADALAEAMGMTPEDEEAQNRLNVISHWGYGTTQGAVRGLLGAVGLSGPVATVAHAGAVWGAQQTMLPALGVACPTWEYGREAVAIDVAHHSVYTLATSVAYEWLDRR